MKTTTPAIEKSVQRPLFPQHPARGFGFFFAGSAAVEGSFVFNRMEHSIFHGAELLASRAEELAGNFFCLFFGVNR